MVKEVMQVDDGVYDAIVEGSKEYKVHLDINHPRKSSCSCPHADGKRIICKHIVAVYFAVNPKEVKRIDKEIDKQCKKVSVTKERSAYPPFPN